MPRPLQKLEPFVGQTLIRDGELFRVIARNGPVVYLQPEAGGDVERCVLGSPPAATCQVP